MKTISLMDVFLAKFPTLREINKEEKLNLPEEFIDFFKKTCFVLLLYGFILGSLFFYVLSELIKIYNGEL